ncbi:MAG: hypothetical protein HY594_05180 [Candidatus Omnitrophica bacterium]|nr:hypothetical protein [Candidatus Omnitrophota bacterium]
MAKEREREGQEEKGATCAECGMEINGAGYTEGNEIYCCQGCADGSGCTCAAEDEEGGESFDEGSTGRKKSRGSDKSGKTRRKNQRTGRKTGTGRRAAA